MRQAEYPVGQPAFTGGAACRPSYEADPTAFSSMLATEASRPTFTSSGTTARRSSGSIPFGWSAATASAARRSTNSASWSLNTRSSYWTLAMSSSAVEPRTALATRVEVTEDTLAVELADGRTIAAPLAWYPRLSHARPQERNTWRLIGGGRGIHWPALDEDISVAN